MKDRKHVQSDASQLQSRLDCLAQPLEAQGLQVVFPLRGPGTPPGRKSPKNGEKLQNSPLRSDPRKRGKITEKLQKLYFRSNLTPFWGLFSPFSGVGPGGEFCNFLGRMLHLELGVDFDRGFSSGFSPPDIFLLFSVIGHAHKVSKSVTKSVSCHRKTQDKKSATKSVAKSVLLGRKIHRKIRHSHQKNPLQFHSAETCALNFFPIFWGLPPRWLPAPSIRGKTINSQLKEKKKAHSAGPEPKVLRFPGVHVVLGFPP